MATLAMGEKAFGIGLVVLSTAVRESFPRVSRRDAQRLSPQHRQLRYARLTMERLRGLVHAQLWSFLDGRLPILLSPHPRRSRFGLRHGPGHAATRQALPASGRAGL